MKKGETRFKPNSYILFWAAVILLITWCCYMVRGILAPFIVALALAYFLDPLVSKLSSSQKNKGLSRSIATVLVLTGLFILIITFILMIVPVIYAQFATIAQIITKHGVDFRVDTWPQVNDFVQSIDPVTAKQIETATEDFSRYIITFMGSVLRGVLSSGITVVSVIALIFITPVLTFYVLRDWKNLKLSLNQVLPLRYKKEMQQLTRDLDSVLTGYLHGQTAVCFLLSLFYIAGLSLIGLNSSFTLGMITGILTFIPYVGTMFGAGLSLIVATIQFESLDYVLAVLGIFILGNVLEGNFISPKLIGDKVGLHPAWIIFGLLAGGYVGGLLGMFISFPLTAVAGVFIRFALTKYQQSAFYQH